VVLLVIVSMVGMFSFYGCKTTAETTAAGETTAAAEVTTAAAEVTTAAAETTAVVAGEQEYYAHPGGWWGIGVWQNVKYGGQKFAEYFNNMGENILMEHPGPAGDDTDAVLAALEATLAKKPIGIMWYPLNIGEAAMLQKYHDEGGFIVNWGGTDSPDYKYDSLIGTDNLVYGRVAAQWAIDEWGDKFSLGIMTMTDLQTHVDRTNGIKEVIAKYPNIKLVEPLMEQTGTSEGAAKNAAAYVAANPDVEVYICTSALGGAAVGRALKEAGYKPGDKKVLTGDTDPETIALIDEGYITGTLSQAFAVESFYAFASMKFLHDNATQITKDDKANGIVPVPLRVITPLFRVTKDNTAGFKDMPAPTN
jgi:ABC-type sugar transport system substrate-binding protein